MIDGHGEVPDLLARWLGGWTAARGVAPAVLDPPGWVVELGLPGRQFERFAAMPPADPAGLAGQLDATEQPTWLTVVVPAAGPAAAALHRAGLRVLADDEVFQSVALATHPRPAVPRGYRIEVTDDGPRTVAALLDEHDAPAAHGTVAVHGTDAVVHEVVTGPAHRRRGLGAAVMGRLAAVAVDRGADIGLLTATAVGAHLYRRLGWATRAALVTAAPAATGPG